MVMDMIILMVQKEVAIGFGFVDLVPHHFFNFQTRALNERAAVML